MMMRVFLLAFLLLAPAMAMADSARILAVVNDEAITETDLNARVALTLASSGIPQDPESRKRITDRVLKSLIDEHLQVQEARRYNIEIEQADIDAALTRIAAANRMSAEQMTAFMKSKGVPRQTIIDQVKANLMWARLAQRVLRPQVEVSKDEVNAALERIKKNEGQPEYHMSEIFLAVDKPSDEERVRELANTLIDRIKQGAPFSAVAQQFSQGIEAINGGDLGWIQPGQLTGELDQAVRKLEVGQISLPVRMAGGFHVLGKRDERIISAADPAMTEAHLQQVSLPLKGMNGADAKKQIDKLTETVKTCADLGNIQQSFPQWSLTDLGKKRVGSLPEWLGKLAARAPLNAPGPVMEKNGYAMVLYVCERQEGGSNNDAIVNTIGLEKLELQAQRLLRDLRRSASIEIRDQKS
jgi:peptidyl-prolyl cis-trans isomerase SurA